MRRRLILERSSIRSRRSRLAEIQLTSTSDIAFLLLIFFLTTAVFVSQWGLPLVLPPAGSQPVAVSESDVLVLSVTADGSVYSGRTEIGAVLTSWALSREQEQPGRIYLLEIEAQCQYANLVSALDDLRAAGVEQISFRKTAGES